MEVEEGEKKTRKTKINETTRSFVRRYLEQILKGAVRLEQNANEGRCLLGSDAVTSPRLSAI